jgi:hypothetical protein
MKREKKTKAKYPQIVSKEILKDARRVTVRYQCHHFILFSFTKPTFKNSYILFL